MGRPKDFPALFGDLVVKYKSKAIADREYKTYMLLAREQKLSKDAKLSDIKVTDVVVSKDEPKVKKQRLVEPTTAGVSSSEKELYERLVEAERLRAEAEKQRGDDLSKIAMMLASGKGGDVVPQSPAEDSPSKTPEPDQREEPPASQARAKASIAKGAGGGAGGGAAGGAGGGAGGGAAGGSGRAGSVTKGKGTGLHGRLQL